MKRYTYIILVTAVLTSVLFVNCSDSFLKKDPPLNMGEKEPFETPDRIQGALLGVYSQFKNTEAASFMGGKTFLVFDNKGEDFVNLDPNLVTLADTYNMRVNTVSAENITTWEQAYLAINNANVFMSRLEESKGLIPDKYEQYKAEALFVRAFTYYYLNMLYGKPYKVDASAKSVPLRLTPHTDASGNNMPRSTVGEVFEQILKDVSVENLAKLPNGINSETATTRATKSAAHALRMRVYMAMEKWNEAIAEGTAITGYSLLSDATKLYATPYYNAEVIFTLPMASNNRPNTQQGVYEYHYTGKIMIVNTDNGIVSKEGYNNPQDARVGKLIGNIEGAKPTDPIKKISIKFPDRDKLDWIPLIRLAEIKLNLAECYAQKGGASEADAKTQLKEVRRRSLADTDDSLLSNAAIDTLTGAALKIAIYNEKRLEFLGEGMRALDIHRRAEDYVKGTGNVKPTDNNYIWPIPVSETSINK